MHLAHQQPLPENGAWCESAAGAVESRNNRRCKNFMDQVALTVIATDSPGFAPSSHPGNEQIGSATVTPPEQRSTQRYSDDRYRKSNKHADNDFW